MLPRKVRPVCLSVANNQTLLKDTRLWLRARQSASTRPVPCSSVHQNGASTTNWYSQQVRRSLPVFGAVLTYLEEYMHQITVIEPKWLSEVAPTFFRVADLNKISKRKQGEKIEPLYDRFAADKDDWVGQTASILVDLLTFSVSANRFTSSSRRRHSVRVHRIGDWGLGIIHVVLVMHIRRLCCLFTSTALAAWLYSCERYRGISQAYRCSYSPRSDQPSLS